MNPILGLHDQLRLIEVNNFLSERRDRSVEAHLTKEGDGLVAGEGEPRAGVDVRVAREERARSEVRGSHCTAGGGVDYADGLDAVGGGGLMGHGRGGEGQDEREGLGTVLGEHGH